jgi:hypothetical protein
MIQDKKTEARLHHITQLIKSIAESGVSTKRFSAQSFIIDSISSIRAHLALIKVHAVLTQCQLQCPYAFPLRVQIVSRLYRQPAGYARRAGCIIRQRQGATPESLYFGSLIDASSVAVATSSFDVGVI